MIINKNKEGQTIIIKKLPNGQRIKARFEKNISKEWAKKEFEAYYNRIRNNYVEGVDVSQSLLIMNN